MRAVALSPDGLLVRRLPLARPFAIPFDALRVTTSEALEDRRGRRIRLSARLREQVEAAMASPAIPDSAPVDEVSRILEGWLGQPHCPRAAGQALVDAARALGASDVHIEAGPERTEVRVRLSGELVTLVTLPARPANRVVCALKGLAGCLPYRSDIVQEGRLPGVGVSGDVRASFVPSVHGERVALRLFGRLYRLEELGLDDGTSAILHQALRADTGLLVVAGATGAGKTTSIYAALAHLAEVRPGAHLSLEEPVEQRLRVAGVHVDQVELDAERGRTAEAMLVAALRQDVDVIAVSEVRTPAEAALAVKAARTGRLVLCGLHAGSAEEAVARLRDLGVEERELWSVLVGVLHQSLQSEPCECDAGCATCRGVGRRRRLHARLLPPAALGRPGARRAA